MPTAFLPLSGLMRPHNKKACGYQCHALAVRPLQIYSTSSRIHIWNPVGGLPWSFFVGRVNLLTPLAVFAEEFRR